MSGATADAVIIPRHKPVNAVIGRNTGTRTTLNR